MSVLLDHDAASYLAKCCSCESNPLYDRRIPLLSPWSIRYQSDNFASCTHRILYRIFLSYLVYVLEGEGDEDIIMLFSVLNCIYHSL